jgi:phage baseplate assembly protein W
MSDFERRLGTDLHLLRNLETQSDRDRGRDLMTNTRAATGLIDLQTLSGVDNIAQALLLRFLTPHGELAVLGHATYGSRLHELIGEPNTETNRNRAKVYVLQSLAEEPRVASVLSARVTQRPSNRSAIDIDLELKIIDQDKPLNLVFPFFLDAGVSA